MKKLLIDSNVVFIAVGQIGEAWAAVILEEVARRRVAAVMDVLSFQELLDRFAHTGELYAGKRIFRCCRLLFAGPAHVTVDDFDRSFELHQQYPQVSPRDLMHAAVALNHGITAIFSVDGTRFSDIAGLSPVPLRALLRTLELQNTYTYERQSVS